VNLRAKESKQACKEAVAHRAAAAWDGPPLAVFPEGSITNGKALTQFKVGAFAPGAPVSPVLLRIPAHGDWDSSWVGENRRHTALWFLRLMCQVSNTCSLELLDVCEPSEAEREDPKLFAERVREVMAAALGVPTTEHAYDDVFFYQEAALQARVGSDFAVAAMQRLFNTDMEELKSWLKTFQVADRDRTGFLSRDEIVQALGLSNHSDAAVDHLFRFFDTDGSGAVEYREFVQVFALLSGRCSPSSLAKLAFLICDTQGTGLVPKHVLVQTLSQSFAEPRPSRAVTARLSEGCEASFGSELLLSAEAQQSHKSSELDFEDFCRLVERHPNLLQSALLRTRGRLEAGGSLVAEGPG